MQALAILAVLDRIGASAEPDALAFALHRAMTAA
jgi:hypothetical protein